MIARVLIGLIVLVGVAHGEPAAPAASADTVALLPLDAEHSLEIYGQPVANQLARALTTSAIAVVVVGAKMAVPTQAQLIVDGTLAADKAGAIKVTVRVRNALDGKMVDRVIETAPELAKLDTATTKIAARLVPIVRDALAAIAEARTRGRADDHPVPAAPLPSGEAGVRFAVTAGDAAPTTAALTTALDAQVTAWMRDHHRQLERIDAAKLAPAVASQAVHGDDFAIGFWVLGYTPESLGDAGHPVPAGRARVRVRIADARAVIFDRVVVTDTVLGELGASPGAVADRVAREVLEILRPHMRRLVRAWE
jgi:hypothetical protein